MTRTIFICALVATNFASFANASTPASYAALDRRTSAACMTASGLANATVGPVTRFSDRFLVDVRTVTGNYPQPHMRGASATMLCLYNRSTRRAEVQQMADVPRAASIAQIKDVSWRATDIGGALVLSTNVRLMLGSDGKVTGNSSCNNFSANYTISGGDIRVYPGMIGTRMSCPANIMEQDTQFRAILNAATSAIVHGDGTMSLTGPSGVLRFALAPTITN